MFASSIGAHQLIIEEDGEDIMAFPIVVLDETAETMESALLCALAAAKKAEQIVLVGDKQQLPPTVTSMGLQDSLGLSTVVTPLKKSGLGETTLHVQYHMPPALLEHPSKFFYNGQLCKISSLA